MKTHVCPVCSAEVNEFSWKTTTGGTDDLPRYSTHKAPIDPAGDNCRMSGERIQEPRKKMRKGFAAMDPALQKQLASKGGKAAHAQGAAHVFTSEEAKAAGRLGGLMGKKNRTAHKLTAEEAQKRRDN